MSKSPQPYSVKPLPVGLKELVRTGILPPLLQAKKHLEQCNQGLELLCSNLGMPPEHQIKLDEVVAFINTLETALIQGRIRQVQRRCETLSNPAVALAHRMHEKRRARSADRIALFGNATSNLQADASRSNGKQRLGNPDDWQPRALPNLLPPDAGGSWHRRQAQALLEELVRDVQNGVTRPTNLPYLIEHRISGRIEKQISHLLKAPEFALAHQVLPSRWKPRTDFQRKLTRANLRHLKAALRMANSEGESMMVKIVPLGGGEPVEYGPFTERGQLCWIEAEHLLSGEVFIKEEFSHTDYIYLVTLIHPVLRQVRKKSWRLFGSDTEVRVKVEWRGSDRVVEYGPFVSSSIVVPAESLMETEIYVRKNAEQGDWIPLPLR